MPNANNKSAAAYFDELIERETANLLVTERKLAVAIADMESDRKVGRTALYLTAAREVGKVAAKLAEDARDLQMLRYHREGL